MQRVHVEGHVDERTLSRAGRVSVKWGTYMHKSRTRGFMHPTEQGYACGGAMHYSGATAISSLSSTLIGLPWGRHGRPVGDHASFIGAPEK